jgi:signal transduction histidine kinase
VNPTKDLFQEELIERLFWFIRLRWIAAGGVLSAILLANMGGLIESLTPLVSISLVLLVLNGLFYYHATRVQEDYGWVTANARVQVICDLIILTLLIHFSGGAENPFLFFFVFHTILASILLEKRESYMFAFTAMLLCGVMILLEYTGTVMHHCMLLHHNPFIGITVPELWKNPAYLSVTFFVFVTTLLISTYLTGSVATRLRERSSRLRVLQEELLRVEKYKWRAVLECMREGVVFVDNEGELAFYNASAADIKDEALTSCSAHVAANKGGDAHPELSGEDHSHDFSRTLSVGGRIYESTCSSIDDSEGGHLGRVIISRDITERKEMERRLMHQEKMTVIGKMGAGIAHELNNPLGVISMFTQMAMKKVFPGEPMYDYLDTIGRNTEVCKKVIQGLLTYARMAPTHRKSLDLNGCINDVLFMCKPLMEKQSIVLETRLNKNLPNYVGDPDQLRQVFMNLIINAVHAMEGGGQLKVLTGMDGRADTDGTIRITFGDNGTGISPKDLPGIFEPFFTTKPEGVGTGLGLSTCKNILEGHGGSISVESEEGKGSTFTILLPVKKDVEGFSKLEEEEPVERPVGLA